MVKINITGTGEIIRPLPHTGSNRPSTSESIESALVTQIQGFTSLIRVFQDGSRLAEIVSLWRYPPVSIPELWRDGAPWNMMLDTVKMSTEFADDQPFDPAALQMRVVELPVPRPFWRLANFYYQGKLGAVDITPVSTKLLSVNAHGSITELSSVGGDARVMPSLV